MREAKAEIKSLRAKLCREIDVMSHESDVMSSESDVGETVADTEALAEAASDSGKT